MKRLISFIIAIIIMITTFSISVGAFGNSEIYNSFVAKKYTPSIDGYISDDELKGSSFDKLYRYFKTGDQGFWLSPDFDIVRSIDNIRLAISYDEKGIYIQADIFQKDYYRKKSNIINKKSNAFIDSTKETDDEFCFDGDVFVFTLDPLGWFSHNGYNENYTAWYCVTNIDSHTVVKRSRVNEGYVSGASAVWRLDLSHGHDESILELFIPWEEISKDCSSASGGKFTPTAEELYDYSVGYRNLYEKEDNTWHGYSIIYADRDTDADSGIYTVQIFSTGKCDSAHPSYSIVEDTYGREVTTYYNPTVGSNLYFAASYLNDFNDVYLTDYDGKWYKDALEFVVSRGYINGISSNMFDINGKMTRAMFVTVLNRISGEDGSGSDDFCDVVKGSWYEKSVGWAVKSGITKGTGDGYFSPDKPISREEAFVMLKRYDDYKNNNIASSGDTVAEFVDYDTVSDFAKDAANWIINEGIVTGILIDDNYYIMPKANISRAEIAKIVMNYCKNT